MEIIIETHGTKVTKESNSFIIEKKDGEKIKLSPRQIETLIIYPGISVSTNALLLAMEKKCEIVFTDQYGHPKGRLWNSEFNSTSFLRRKQYEVFGSELGSEIGKKYIIDKLEGLLKIMLELKIRNIESELVIGNALENIKEIKGKPDIIRDKIMGYEGSAGRAFYKNISNIFPEKYKFQKRELQNATKEFNIILNYYYGVLYRICEGELIRKGLDPFLGIFHSDSYNKKSFLYDFIESFRPWAILRAVKFIKNKNIRLEHFECGELTKEGKKEIMIYLNTYLDKKEKYNGKMYTRRDIIGKRVEELARQLRGDENEISIEL